MHKKNRSKKGGYIALMATIIISAILLSMMGQQAFAGSFTRFVVLGTEAKEQATSLAEGCADQAIALLTSDPTYSGDADATFATQSGTASCHIFPIEFNTPSSGKITIKTQGVVRDAYANLQTVHEMDDIHASAAAAPSNTATLIVKTHVSGGPATAKDFTMQVAGQHPSRSTFSGKESGVTVILGPGAYSVSESVVAGYSTSPSSDCSGTLALGQTKTCTVSNAQALSTLTLIAQVTNDDGTGSNAPNDFSLFIDGTPAQSGTAYPISQGSHVASGETLPGYGASPWGYQCSGNGSVFVSQGEEKTCMITYDDIPPAALSCADTVMILDRTGSINATERANEKAAANTLLDFYSLASPAPKVSIGSFGGYDGSGAQIPPGGVLSATYTTLRNTLNQIMSSASSVGSNLSMAIDKSKIELESPRHTPGKEKVLIFVSDGLPNRPTNESVGTLAARASADFAKASGIRIFTIHYGQQSGQAFLQELSSGADSFFIAPNSSDLKGIFETIAKKVCTPPPVTPVAAPEKATLRVVTQVINNNNGTKTAGDFSQSITGQSPSPSSWSGMAGVGKSIMLYPGTYQVSQTPTAGYTQTLSLACSSSAAGAIGAGQTRVCTVTNDDIPPPPAPPKPIITPGASKEVPNAS